MSRTRRSPILGLVALLWMALAAQSFADPITNEVGIERPHKIVTFDEPVLPGSDGELEPLSVNVRVGDQFAPLGVIFEDFRDDWPSPMHTRIFRPFPGLSLVNSSFGSECHQPPNRCLSFKIRFTEPVSAAAIRMASCTGGDTSMTAKLQGAVRERLQVSATGCNVNGEYPFYFGFEGFLFDTIWTTPGGPGGKAFIGNVQFIKGRTTVSLSGPRTIRGGQSARYRVTFETFSEEATSDFSVNLTVLDEDGWFRFGDDVLTRLALDMGPVEWKQTVAGEAHFTLACVSGRVRGQRGDSGEREAEVFARLDGARSRVMKVACLRN